MSEHSSVFEAYLGSHGKIIPVRERLFPKRYICAYSVLIGIFSKLKYCFIMNYDFFSEPFFKRVHFFFVWV